MTKAIFKKSFCVTFLQSWVMFCFILSANAYDIHIAGMFNIKKCS